MYLEESSNWVPSIQIPPVVMKIYLIVPVGEGGEAPCNRLSVSGWGMLMVNGFMPIPETETGDIFSGESGNSTESKNSDSSIND